jgi:N-hydroxyarylamine O-acetyltransferase
MDRPFDLDAYLARIGYRGAVAPTEDALAALVRAHVERVPFENLDVLLGRGASLELPRLTDKIVARGRGGYCFEQTTLFCAALEAFGFSFARHSARVIGERPREVVPRTHMFVTVRIGARTLVADPGFGNAPRAPIPLEDGATVRVEHDVHRLARDEGEWLLQAGEARSRQWTSSLAVDLPIDFELANYYKSTHPKSAFVSTLMLRAWTREGRVGLVNRDATFWRDGVPEKFTLADRAELRAFVAKHLGFDLPEIEAMKIPAVPEWTS